MSISNYKVWKIKSKRHFNSQKQTHNLRLGDLAEARFHTTCIFEWSFDTVRTKCKDAYVIYCVSMWLLVAFAKERDGKGLVPGSVKARQLCPYLLGQQGSPAATLV